MIQKAGGIDNFLVQEGYGREFGILRCARAPTTKAGQVYEATDPILAHPLQ